MLPRNAPSSAGGCSGPNATGSCMAIRWRRPYRALPEISARDAILPDFDPHRGLLVGVLPHPFCNPKVAGCGFCTFPHEAFTSRKAAVVIDHVVREIEQTLRARPGLAGRPIDGLYFGGGTANLSPPEPFRKLCRALRKPSISRQRR